MSIDKDKQTIMSRVIFNSVAAFGLQLSRMTRGEDNKFALYLTMPEDVQSKINPDYFIESGRVISVVYFNGAPTSPMITLDLGPTPSVQAIIGTDSKNNLHLINASLWRGEGAFSREEWTNIVREWAAVVSGRPDILKLAL